MRLDSISTVVHRRGVLNKLRMALLSASVGPTFTFCRFNALFSFLCISIIAISLAYAPHAFSASYEYQGIATINIRSIYGGDSIPYVDPVPLSLCDPYLRAFAALSDPSSSYRNFIATKSCYLNTPIGSSPEISGNFSYYITPTWIGSSYAIYLGPVTKSCNAGDRLTSHSPVPYGTCTNTTCNPPSVWSPITNKCTTPDKNPPQSCNASSPYPINYATGNKILAEQDYTLNANNSVAFTRYYNSRLNAVGLVGTNWLGNIHSQILVDSSSSVTGSSLIMVKGDGLKIPFTYSGSAWISDADITDKLTELKDTAGARAGWIYTQSKTNKVETYDVTGKLLSIADRSGYMQSFNYDSSNRIATINDGLGRAIHFSYDASNRISTLTNPAGGVYTYAYSIDGNNNLTSVIYPDGKTKTYLYENTTFKNALTGILDENSSRYMTYTYDSNGRATDEISPTFGTNVNHYALSYNPGISTTVTDPLGSARTYNFTTILGVVKSTGQSQPAGSGCAASAAALTYDANGNVASRTDFKGNKTTYVYDLSRNLETSRTEGLTTAGASTSATRTVTTTWHNTWHLPLVVSEYNGATATGTPVKTTTTAYDDKGNITSITEADPVRNVSRTTTMTYTYSSAVPGLMLSKVIDGPRTDVNDVTTYSYYPHDATCAASTATPIVDPITGTSPVNLGCRGQLMSVQNSLGQTTSYDRYNHHGQLEQMTDANGLVTTSTYDLRQRLLTKTIGTEVTSLTYDNVGQVTQLTLPDSSSLNYTYDAAHRLTEVQDSLGNKVSYTLDTEGNRINEVTTDPQGNLAKTLVRSYDALSRLQQVTGIE